MQRTKICLALVGLVAVVLVVLAGFAMRDRLRLLVGDSSHVSQGHSHGPTNDGHGHAHADARVSATVWTDAVEVFVDHDVAVAGTPLEPAVHLTLLNTGQPPAEARLTYRAAGAGDARYEATADQPLEPGIWLPKLTITEPGRYEVTVQVEAAELEGGSTTVPLPALLVFKTMHAGQHAFSSAQGDQEAITFLKDQQWRVGLRTMEVQPRPLVEHLVVPGRVVAPPFAEAQVPPPVAGRITPPVGSSFPQLGQQVKKGQILAVLEPSVVGSEAVQLWVNQAQIRTLDAELAARQLEAEARLKATEFEMQYASANYERLDGLSSKGITAGKEMLAARNEMNQAQARHEGLLRLLEAYNTSRQQLTSVMHETHSEQTREGAAQAMRVELRSPLTGTVVKARATAGEFVNLDHTLFQIINLDRLYIEARVSEYDLAKLESSPGASYRLSGYPDRLFPILGAGEGRLVSVGSVVDPDNRTVPIRYEVPNAERLLRIGMYTDVLIETGRSERALAVPEVSVVDDSGEAVAFVQTEGESFQRRPLKIGLTSAGQLEVVSGLEVGDRVVTSGAYALRLSTLSGSIPGHHHH